MRRALIAAAVIAALAACSREAAAPKEATPAAAAAQPVTPRKVDLPAGVYTLDKGHGSLLFRVSHLGMSNYTARFTDWDARLKLDPANPAASSVEATVDVRSLETHYPEPEKLNFNAQLISPDWLDAARHPEMRFRSTRVELTGPDTARMTGDLTLRGVTRPVTLEAKFNGGYAGNSLDPAGSRLGFSARGTLKRSEFGLSLGVPAPGSDFGVSDTVEVIIEAEFTRPRDGAARG